MAKRSISEVIFHANDDAPDLVKSHVEVRKDCEVYTTKDGKLLGIVATA